MRDVRVFVERIVASWPDTVKARDLHFAWRQAKISLFFLRRRGGVHRLKAAREQDSRAVRSCRPMGWKVVLERKREVASRPKRACLAGKLVVPRKLAFVQLLDEGFFIGRKRQER